MLLDSLFRYLVSGGPPTRAKRLRRRAARHVPTQLLLEPLEHRALPSFLAPQGFDVGVLPRSVAVGEFNGDGLQDLAVASEGEWPDFPDRGVSVLLGKGDGTFRPARIFPTRWSAFFVAAGDVNADGFLDLVAADLGGVNVLLGNGEGTFQPARFFLAGNTPRSVAMEDFNNDGHLDLAVANRGGDTGDVSVLLGNGDGTFRDRVNYPAGLYPVSVAVGEFNGDGQPDLAVAGDWQIMGVLLGNGDGTFGAARFFAAGELRSVAVGEFNGDGFQDLVTGSVILLGNGDGTFQAPRSLPDRGHSVAVADVNDDGIQDLATSLANSSNHDVRVLLGHGDGTFQAPRSFRVGYSPLSVAVGEFNGDGRPDIAVDNSNGSNVSVHLGNGDGLFQAAPSFAVGSEPLRVAAGDFNHDGLPDLAVPNTYSNTVSVFLGNGDGTFQAARHLVVGSYPFAVAVGDFNRDGRQDLAVTRVCCPTPGYVSVLLGNGDGTFQAARDFVVGVGPVSVAVGDFNGDGISDLALIIVSRASVGVLLGNGDGTFQPPRYFPAGDTPQAVAAGDFNGDGIPDLVTGNSPLGEPDNVSVLLGNGDGTFQAARHFDAGGFRLFVGVGDFNGDGIADLATAGSPAVSVLLGNGDGTFQRAMSFAVGPAPEGLAVEDYNGDGIQDLAAAFYGGVRLLLGNGNGTFQTTHVTYVAGAFPRSLASADFNGDGWPDLATANWLSDDVSILLNEADDAVFFYLDAPAAVPAGQPFDLTAFALSADWQRLAYGYRGSVAFWSSDEAATLPEPYRFRPEDWGIASFPGGVTLRTPGTQYLVAFDLETFTVIGIAVIEVTGRAGPGFGGAAGPGLDLFIAEVLVDASRPARR